MAKLILDENREYLGNEMVDELLKRTNTEEGGNDKMRKSKKKQEQERQLNQNNQMPDLFKKQQ